MKHLERLGPRVSVSIPIDENGFIGRECPRPDCEGYFKIEPGTGLKGEDLPCCCPYCGHQEGQGKFFTKAQIEYAQSVVLNKVSGAFLKNLKSLEFNHKPRGGFGIGISMKVTGRPTPIRRYREQDLETEVICDKCTLRYTIYGVFAFCPDCRVHNSLQILEKNFDLIEKLLTVAESQDAEITNHLIENAMGDCISAFDGFGRETCYVFSFKAKQPEKVTELRFQSIAKARSQVIKQFGADFGVSLKNVEWNQVVQAFQKRHLLAHKMGVIDEAYQKATDEPPSLIGRRVSIQSTEVHNLLQYLRTLGRELYRAVAMKS